jgi:hypothetical protein
MRRCDTIAALMPIHFNCDGSAAVAARTRSQVMTRPARFVSSSAGGKSPAPDSSGSMLFHSPSSGSRRQRQLDDDPVRRTESVVRARIEVAVARHAVGQRGRQTAARRHTRQLIAQRRVGSACGPVGRRRVTHRSTIGNHPERQRPAGETVCLISSLTASDAGSIAPSGSASATQID